MTQMPPAASPQRLNLALQGGGSHGAFTWGVLDALLEDGGFAFPGISGTSAGAMNAVALAQGFAAAALEHPDDPQARHSLGCVLARAALKKLWEGVGAMGVFTLGVPVANNPLMNLMSQFLSPYQTNPLDINPLRKLLERVVDFDMLAQVWGQEGMPKLFVCATNVRTGKGEIFSEQRISADAIMASACLPQLYQAVEIDGEYPLIYRTDCSDMLLVQINPIESPDLPDTASDIAERMNEVMFNAGLLGELRAIDFVRRLLAEGKLDPQRYKSVLMHRIDGGAALARFGAASKSRVDMGFLQQLFALGRRQGQQWVQDHRNDVGVRQTLQIVDNP